MALARALTLKLLMSYPLRSIILAAVVLPASLPAVQTETLPPITIVNSRLAPEYRLPDAIDRKLRRSEIESQVPVSTIDLVQSVPGVDALSAGGRGGLTFVSIRGGDPNYTLFLLDGVKINDPTNSRGGGVDLYTIPTALIDSIEVSARPASAVQGSDGLSGTVSIATMAPRGMRFSGELDDQGSSSGMISVGGDLSDRLSGSLSAGREDETNGVENDSLRNTYLLARATAEPSANASLGMLHFLVDGEARSFPEDSGGDRLALIRAPEIRDYRREVSAANAQLWLGDGSMLKGASSWSTLEEKTDNPGIAPGTLPGVPALSGKRTYRRFDGQLYLVSQPHHQVSTTAGIAYEREKGTTDDLIDFGGFVVPADFSLKRDSWSVFAEIAYAPMPNLNLQSGLRHDMPDSASDETSLSFGAAYAIPQFDTTVSFSYGQGYKLPSLFALGHSLVGNPDLSPEYSEAIEVGVRKRWPHAGVELGVSLFHNEYTDLIDFDPLLFTNVNRGEVRAQGADAELAWRLHDDIDANVSVTYSDADIIGEPGVLRRRPRWKGGASLRWGLSERFTWWTSADHTGSFYDSSIPTGQVKLPSFWRLNTALTWRYTDTARISLGVKNLLDDDYEESVGFSNGGITVSLGASVTI